jgi:hypothetical protein
VEDGAGDGATEMSRHDWTQWPEWERVNKAMAKLVWGKETDEEFQERLSAVVALRDRFDREG